MLPIPAMMSWSVRTALSPVVRLRRMAAKRSQPIWSSKGSIPRWASSGTTRRSASPSPPIESRANLEISTSWPSSGGIETNSSPKVRGSTKRSSPPWAKVNTTWVCLGLGSLGPFARSSWPLMPRWITRCVALSSPTTRYLPRRSTDLTLWPSTRERNSLAVLWRRTIRPLVTATDFTFLPTRSRASDARTVSTSGSSGIAPLPGHLGGGGLGGLLGPSPAGAAHRAVDRDGGVEDPRVRGALGAQVVGRAAPGRPPPARLHRPLQEPGLGVDLARVTGGLGDLGAELGGHELARRVKAALEVDRRDQRLVGVGEQGGAPQALLLDLAAAHAQVGGEVEARRGAREGRLVDHA